MIERGRPRFEARPQLERIVVALDPALTSGEDADETGLVVAGKEAKSPAHGYVLADGGGHYEPTEWAKKAIELYCEYRGDRIVAEVNAGGEMVEATLRIIDPNVAYRAVHAKKGKYVRAEPVAALYEQGRVKGASWKGRDLAVFRLCTDGRSRAAGSSACG